MRIFKNRYLLSIVVGLAFLLIGGLTLKDYNIMWDARGHFMRGQGYLNFFLTGNKEFNPIFFTPDYLRYYRDYLSRSSSQYGQIDVSKVSSERSSIFKDKIHGFTWYLKDFGHPSLSDIGAALFNVIFYEKLGLLKDDLAYNLFALFLSSILVGVVFHWIRKSYGILPAVISTLTLSTYPLFWAESHFNIKDIPLMVFFALSIWAFWQGITLKSKIWIIVSSVFAGCALATKFNALFLSFILIPWFFIFYFGQPRGQRKIYHGWWYLILVYPLIMFAILFLSYPFLWSHPLQNISKELIFYQNIGSNIDYTPLFRTLFGFNSYPILWITFTTYPFVIALSIVGVIMSVVSFMKKQKDTLPLLFLIWLIVPILRVIVPQSAIYDGARQIMEYIPALSLLSGYGAYRLIGLIPKRLKNAASFILIIVFLPLIITLTRIHPAENAYFNSLIGGINGARKIQLTGWGNTDGGIYRVAVEWLNRNAKMNSHVAVGFSDTADFYIPSLRRDLIADNQFSGYLQKGEYIVALTHDTGLEQTYRMLYPEIFLTPVYEYSIDGVPLVKIWKNEKKYLKPEMVNLHEEMLLISPQRVENVIIWDLGKSERLEKIEFSFKHNSSCRPLANVFFQISDNGKKWNVLPDAYPGGPIDLLGEQPKEDSFIAVFAGVETRFISFFSDTKNACVLDVGENSISVLR